MKENNNQVENKSDIQKSRQKNKKPNIFKRMGKKFKEVVSELKKVSWPSWKKVVKQTSIVLGVVICFTIVISLMDFGLSKLLELVTKIAK